MVCQSVAKVLAIDFNLWENAYQHRTERFELVQRGIDGRLVVRRGNPFLLTLVLSRTFRPETDAFVFQLTLAEAEHPNEEEGTLVYVPLLHKGERLNLSWNATLQSVTGNRIVVLVTPSASSLVGEWKIAVESQLLPTGPVFTYSHPSSFFVLFNPWCPNDQVYLADETLRNEYVLEETGIIYRGTVSCVREGIWRYGQFAKDVLECSLYLLSKIGGVGVANLGDPVVISRAMSAVVNGNNPNGVILGNWLEDCEVGTPPTDWLGSMEILQQYWRTKATVLYGQCWTFAGLLTTIARALGIPARTVTNFCSAHDVNRSLTVDIYYNEQGDTVESKNLDSVWNFHVWSEVWMKRPDLGNGGIYDGWQAVDGTPQEMSDNVYRCGPASIAAVKRGEVLLPYDSAFLFASVNADKVFWKADDNDQIPKMLGKDTTTIGQLISTKAVGAYSREDITSSYKYPEDSTEERENMKLALSQNNHNSLSQHYLNVEFDDLHFDFPPISDVIIGSHFFLVLTITNKRTDSDHEVDVILRMDAVDSAGEVGHCIKKIKFGQTIQAGTTQKLSLPVEYEDYASMGIDENGSFNATCLAKVLKTDYDFFDQNEFRIITPEMKFEVDGEAMAGKSLTVTVFFTNPLPVPLHHGKFRFGDLGCSKNLKIKHKQCTEPGEEVKASFVLLPHTAGTASIYTVFKSKQLPEVHGLLELDIEEAELSEVVCKKGKKIAFFKFCLC